MYIKAILVTVCICIFPNTRAQKLDAKKVELQNIALINKIKEYTVYIKDWAKRANVSGYIIALDQEKMGDNSVFTLSTFLSSKSIDRFRPSAYTAINNCPVIINSGFEDYIKPDIGLIKFLKDKYWKGTSETSVPLSENEMLMKEFNESVRNSTDSVNLIMGEEEVKRVPKSAMKMHIETNAPTVSSNPKSWVLYVKGPV